LLQQPLYASNRYAVLPIFRAMDAAGKDGAIRHVVNGGNKLGQWSGAMVATRAERNPATGYGVTVDLFRSSKFEVRGIPPVGAAAQRLVWRGVL
jgi:hypothetical protein